LELIKEGTTFVTLPTMELKIISVAILVAIVLGTFVFTTKSLVLVVGIAIVTVAFFNFTSFAFNFWVFTTEVFNIVALVD
jgi:hypothetical protein